MLNDSLIRSEYYEIHKKVLKQKREAIFEELLNIPSEETHHIADLLGTIKGLSLSFTILEGEIESREALQQQEANQLVGIDIPDEFKTAEEERYE